MVERRSSSSMLALRHVARILGPYTDVEAPGNGTDAGGACGDGAWVRACVRVRVRNGSCGLGLRVRAGSVSQARLARLGSMRDSGPRGEE
jgi:hypothetical protein